VTFERIPPIAHPSVNPVRLQLQRYPDMRTGWAAFLRHEADVLYDVTPSAVASLRQNPDIRLMVGASRGQYTMGFRRRNLLRDVRVRQAINLAIDRHRIVQRLYGDSPSLTRYATPVAGPFSPEYWALEGAESLWPYDPVAARALLKEATGGRSEPIELSCIIGGEFPDFADIAAIVEAQLQRVNIRVRFEPLSFRAFVTRVAQGDFDMYLSQMATSHGGLWAYTFWHSGGDEGSRLLRSGYTAADDALDRLYTAESPDAERAAVRAVMDVMHRDPPAAFLITRRSLRAVRSTWHVPDEGREIELSLDRWTLDAPCER
jgi:peptide/nickel transport system substrate-binding protein